MAIDPRALPEHPDDLRAYCLRLLTELDETNHHLETLRHELELFKRTLYGRRSEKLDAGQLMLEFAHWIKTRDAEAASTAEAAAAAADSPASPSTPPASSRPAPERTGHGRQRLPRLLPRQRVVHELPAEHCRCRECGETLVAIGEETSEQLDYKPASLFVVEHVRVKYACHACAGHVALAELPAQPIDKGLPGSGLLAQVAVAKFADHLPLHRQEQIFARHGVEISRQSMCDWMAAVANLLEPMYLDLKASVLAGKVVHTDDSPVPVQDRTRTTTREGRLWVYVGDKSPADIVYDYTPNHTREGPRRFLGDYRGYLQADAYAGYDVLYETGHVVEVGCWAHARRYFFEAKDTDPGHALPVLAMIQELYKVEAEGHGLGAEGRRALRQEKAQPILKRLKERLEGDADVVLPRSPMGKAVATRGGSGGP